MDIFPVQYIIFMNWKDKIQDDMLFLTRKRNGSQKMGG